MSISVVYLARFQEGIGPIRDFVQSYMRHSAGAHHDLVILFKGFSSQVQIDLVQEEFKEIKYRKIELVDEGFDIGSYYKAANILSSDYLLFLNTFSIIRSHNWLKKLYSGLLDQSVGLVGVTGSLQSVHSWLMLIQKAYFLLGVNRLDPLEKLKLQKYFMMPQRGARLFLRSLRKYLSPRALRHCFYEWKNNAPYSSVQELEEQYKKWWQIESNKQEMLRDFFCVFPLFPNVHLRTNAFMLKREPFLSLDRPSFCSKWSTCFFESGAQSMTRQILNSGKDIRVVGADGMSYSVSEWHSSNTFRGIHQENLLVSDNQTRGFDAASDPEKEVLRLTTWGTEAVPFPPDFPNLSINFDMPSSLEKILYLA